MARPLPPLSGRPLKKVLRLPLYRPQLWNRTKKHIIKGGQRQELASYTVHPSNIETTVKSFLNSPVRCWTPLLWPKVAKEQCISISFSYVWDYGYNFTQCDAYIESLKIILMFYKFDYQCARACIKLGHHVLYLPWWCCPRRFNFNKLNPVNWPWVPLLSLIIQIKNCTKTGGIKVTVESRTNTDGQGRI